ncbi:NAD(P)H-dependent oxidoreductase [Cellulosimicrobium sp. PMB13]|uniref:NADPH-dependent FMN reductase n=1 Tax=Cellulosimicrobium sp. PMB13 TaxID=3120158 RepID=UPI003F4C4523
MAQHLSPTDPSLTDPATVVVVSGNPRPGSRTLTAARALADRVAAHLDLAAPDAAATIDLANLAGEILSPEHPAADAATARLAAARVAVVATPVYKASYTGLLKAFLDLYGPGGLAGVAVVPLVVSGNPAHALAGEVHLRPVLVELGAVVPTRTLAVTENQLADLDAAIDAWLLGAGDALRRAAGGPDDRTPAPAAALAGVAR